MAKMSDGFGYWLI